MHSILDNLGADPYLAPAVVDVPPEASANMLSILQEVSQPEASEVVFEVFHAHPSSSSLCLTLNISNV